MTRGQGTSRSALPTLTLEKSPPRAPQITWDGNQLPIKSDNLTLANILIQCRS